MKINLTIIVSILAVVGLLALGFTLFQVYQERSQLTTDLERRSSLLADSLSENVLDLLATGKRDRLQPLVDRFGNRQRMLGVAVYDAGDRPLAVTKGVDQYLDPSRPLAAEAIEAGRSHSLIIRPQGRDVHVLAAPLRQNGAVIGALVLFHDAGYIADIIKGIWRTNFFGGLIQALVVALVTLLVIRWSVLNPMGKMVNWMKAVRLGEHHRPQAKPAASNLFAPLGKEVDHLAQSVEEARATAQEEARLRASGESVWTPERLKEEVRTLINGRSVVAVSNREPYMHVHSGRGVECIVPASGLVTALEPVLKACGGTWVATGSGDADRETVDERDRLAVPPGDPKYTLKRVWLTKEEEEGFYYGFANEGLWPLCHIAHARPTFRLSDWQSYQAVNRLYAKSVLEVIKDSDQPLVLVQDFHFALLPGLIKERRPDARVAIFWHIPWPNPESFGICPWQKDLLTGMLGADLIGFHTQYHCNNFLETVDQALESQIVWENFSVKMAKHRTAVRPFPISIAFTLRDYEQPPAPPPEINDLLKDHGIKAEILGVGVDRIDYTKGIIERFQAVGRLMEKYPEFQKRFTFVELGAPSRTHIKRYADLVGEVESEAERVNWKFRARGWKPILFLKKHHSHREIAPFYQAARVCLVTSLHDGMNLVAKEYLSARSSNDGVLILSRFTGAARELRDALIVNPYDIEQMADALRFALEMPLEEQSARMGRMRRQLMGHNVYMWAANVIRELTAIRL